MDPTYAASTVVFGPISCCTVTWYCSTYGVRRLFSENRFGVFGSVKDVVGNPLDSMRSPGTEQSCTAAYDGRLHGPTKFCDAK